MKKILWADDEIDMLQAHVLFLREKGYQVETVTNGDDAVFRVKDEDFDIVLLDEMMTGKDGLSTLNEIKDIYPHLPVIMITKNEEESLMEEAIGKRIDDYLTKPVNPSQILMACKKILDRQEIINLKRTEQIAREISQLSMALMNPLTPDHWIELTLRMVRMDMDLDITKDENLRHVLFDQRREINVEFSKYIERNYPNWVQQLNNPDRPLFSVDIISKYIVPRLREGERVVFLVIDCLRLDQWLVLEPFFNEWFRVDREHYFSILPTATPFSRNALFSGLFPEDIETRYPELWSLNEDDESLNRYERELLELQLRRQGIELGNELKYIKIMNNEDARMLSKNLNNYLDSRLLAIVVNFVDILAHSRSDLPILKEIVPDEAAYRSLTASWFVHSPMSTIMREIAAAGKTCVLTSDHGSIRGMRDTRVIGDKETSTNLRYKYGRSLKADRRHATFVKNPSDWKLPKRGINTTYLIAKEDFYFIYPTNYNRYMNYYRDSFQHGGISIEEMILPAIQLVSRK